MTEPMSSLIRSAYIASIEDKDNSKVLVIGGGIAGLNLVNYLDFIGVKHITLTQRSENRRKLIANLKFKNVTVLSDTELHSDYLQNIGDQHWGFDNIIDCTGNSEAIENGIKYLRPAGKFVMYGVPSKDFSININAFDFMFREKQISGALVQPNDFEDALNVIIKLSRAGRLNFHNYGAKEYNLEDFETAFSDLESRKIIKAFILP